jgi:hypothetical protein
MGSARQQTIRIKKSFVSDPQRQTDEFTLPSRNLLRADYRRKANCPQSLASSGYLTKAGFVPSPSLTLEPAWS